MARRGLDLRIAVPGGLVAVGILAGCLGYRELYGPDIGFHLESGRRVLERGVQVRDDLTWTDGARRHVDLQWLWEVGIYGMFRMGGTFAVVLSNIALTLAAMAVATLRAFRRQGRIAATVPVWLFLFVLANLWEVRPHAASWLLLGAVLLVLEERRRGGRRVVWILPPLLLVWVNVHSLYVLGLVAIGIHVLVALREDARSARPLLIAAALSVLACCVNPFGLEALLYPIRQLGEISGASIFNRADTGIVEFRSPWSLAEYSANGALVLLQPILFLHLAAALAAIGTVLGWRRLDLADALVLAGFGLTFWQAEKNFGYFALAALPAVGAGFAVPASSRGKMRFLARSVAWSIPILCLVLWLQWRSGWYYAQQRLPHRVGHAFNQSFLPVRACAFLDERVPAGRLLNHWDQGGYISFATRRPTFIDSRTEVMGEAFFAAYHRLFDPATIAGELERWRPDIALVPLHAAPLWQARLSRDPEWRLVYADEQDFIYLKRDFAPEVPALDPARNAIPAAARIDAALDRAMSRGSPSFFATLRGPHHDPIVESRWTASWLVRGRPEAALEKGIEGLELATLPAPRLLNNVMMALLQVGDVTRAGRCYDALPSRLKDPALGDKLRRALERR